MNKIFCTLFAMFVALNCLSQKKLAGEYRCNYAQNGYIVEQLNLLCDSTFIFERSGDKQAFIVKGSWVFLNSHVILLADTTASKPNSLFWDRWYFNGNELFEYSATDYKQYVKNSLSFKDTSAEIIDIPEPNMHHYKNPNEFKLYYLKRVHSINCSGNY